MGVTQLPGWYDEIAPYVQQLSNIIPNLINPHLQQQRLLQQHIAANPQIAQQLADMEANSPGITNQLGFGNISGKFSAIPESSESRAKKEKDQAIKNLTPEQQQERQANLAGIMNPAELKLHGLNVERVTKELQKTDQDIAENDRQRLQLEKVAGLEKQFGEWSKGKGKFNLYAARRSGEVPEWMAEAVTISPKISKQYDQDAQDYFREKEIDLERQRLAVQKEGTRMSHEEWKLRSQQDQAERMAYRAGSTNIDGFLTLIQNPGLGTQLRKMSPEELDNVAKQSPQFNGAVDAIKAQGQVDEKAKQGIYNNLRSAYTAARVAADKFRNGNGSELEVQSAIDSYNQRLEEGAGAGIQGAMLKWDVKPGATKDAIGPAFLTGTTEDTRKQIIRINPATGQLINSDEKDFLVPDPTKSEEFKQQIDKDFQRLIAMSPAERDKALNDLKNNRAPEAQVAYNELNKRIGGKPPEPNKKVSAPEPKKVEPKKEKSKFTPMQFSEMRTQYMRAIPSERQDYLNEWQASMSPEDLKTLKKILGIK